jgi:small-conductance mechanosensitive channel
VVLILLAAAYYLIRLRVVHIEPYFPYVQRFCLGSIAIVMALAVTKTLDVYLISRVEDAASEYNIRSIVNLVTAIVNAIIVVSMLFANWYTAVVLLGLVSLILGLDLRTPITSFIGWVYIFDSHALSQRAETIAMATVLPPRQNFPLPSQRHRC